MRWDTELKKQLKDEKTRHPHSLFGTYAEWLADGLRADELLLTYYLIM
jgi:hypothetical protein